MATAKANSNAPVITGIDYDSLRPQLRGIHWSSQRQAHVADVYDKKTDLKAILRICIPCITVHLYYDCDKKRVHYQFEDCDLTAPVYHPSYMEAHAKLEYNNREVRQAILRTPRSRLVRDQYGILVRRGYDPPEVKHVRHIATCLHGPSPQTIIQGSSLSTGIYYRRCDGKFRNVAYQELEMDTNLVITNQQSEANNDKKDDDRMATAMASLTHPSKDTISAKKASLDSKMTVSKKRKWEE